MAKKGGGRFTNGRVRQGNRKPYFNRIFFDSNIQPAGRRVSRFTPDPGSPSTILTGLSSYYKFNGNVLDAHGPNNGTAFNVNYASGECDQVAVFNGINSYVKLSDGKIENTNTGYISAKINTSNYVDQATIFSYGGTDPNLIFRLCIYESGGVNYIGIVSRDQNNGGLGGVRGSTPLLDDTTYQLGWASSGTAYKLYVNGNEETVTLEFGENSGNWFLDLESDNDQCVVGAMFQNGALSRYFDGQIWDISIGRTLFDYEHINLWNQGNCNEYPFRPSYVQTLETLLFEATTEHTVHAPLKPVLLPNGDYLFGVSRWNGPPEDFGEVESHFYTSRNLMSDEIALTNISSIAPDPAFNANFVQDILLRSDISLYGIFLEAFDNVHESRIVRRTSTDNALTWSDRTVMVSEAGKYYVTAGSRLFVTNTGRWLFTYSQLQDPYDINTSDYWAYVMWSDDEGETWTTGDPIESPDGRALEGGFYQLDDNTVVFLIRSATGVSYAFNSSDDGETFGAAYDLGLLNQAVHPNTLTVLKLTGGGYISNYGYLTRAQLQVAYSATGLPDSWTYIYLGTETEVTEEVSGALMFDISGILFLLYLKTRELKTLYDSLMMRVVLESYTP